MKNKDFRIGDNILVCGNKGIIAEINNFCEYYIEYNGKPVNDGKTFLTDEDAIETIKNGYTLKPTGKTATYFKVNFIEESLKNTCYDGGFYGCLDEFENYGTW